MELATERSIMDVSIVTTTAPTAPRQINLTQQLLGSEETTDRVDVGLNSVYKSLTVVGDEILKKLEEILAEDLPEGLSSLRPEDYTPEKTAERIVQGVTALLPVFAAQNPDMEEEELMEAFMNTVKGGIEEGLGEAMDILEAVGALEVEGIREGIEQTMQLVDEKLNAFKDAFLAPKKIENTDTNDTTNNDTEKPQSIDRRSPLPTDITA